METLYEVSVGEALKGSVASVITIVVDGGRIAFPDGTAVEVRTPGFAVALGKRYVFLIKPWIEEGGISSQRKFLFGSAARRV